MKKRMEERSKLFARKKLFSGCLNKFQCHTMQELAMTDEYARFVKRTILHSTSGLHVYTPKQKDGDDNSSASNGTLKM